MQLTLHLHQLGNTKFSLYFLTILNQSSESQNENAGPSNSELAYTKEAIKNKYHERYHDKLFHELLSEYSEVLTHQFFYPFHLSIRKLILEEHLYIFEYHLNILQFFCRYTRRICLQKHFLLFLFFALGLFQFDCYCKV